MKKELKDIETNSGKFCDLRAEHKAEIAPTTDGASNTGQTITALKREFNDLIDQINVMSGKLNVIKQRAKEIKMETIKEISQRKRKSH